MFLRHPRTPMVNNLAERLLKGPAIGRRLSFGSDSPTGAKLPALVYPVVGTLDLNGIDVPRWLDAWPAACARKLRPAPGRPRALATVVDGRCRRRELAAPT